MPDKHACVACFWSKQKAGIQVFPSVCGFLEEREEMERYGVVAEDAGGGREAAGG